MNASQNTYFEHADLRMMKIKFKKIMGLFLLAAGSSLFGGVAFAASLDDVSYSALPGERARIILTMSAPLAADPLSFTIDNPARLAIDLPGTTLNLADRSQRIGIGMADSLNAVEAAGRTRVVINLARSVSYDMVVEGSNVILTLGADMGRAAPAAGDTVLAVDSDSSGGARLENIDFRRGENGEGRVIVDLSDPAIPVDMGFRGGRIVVNFIDAQLPAELNRRLDVIDFATPVKEIDTAASDNNVTMTISTVTDSYDHLAYQTEDKYIIEFKPLAKEEEASTRDKFNFTGERLSLNFQDIEVRAVLQLIADFTDLNMVTSDSVGGNVTLRLKNVPWDQALDIILKSRGLAMRQAGNVIMVAPAEEIAARERLELEAERQVQQLAPLRTEFVKVNYANATDLIQLIQAEENKLLSERGNVAIDERTNTLIVQDVASSLSSIRALIEELDVPVRQVLIESRIVNADERFAKDVGVRFGYSKNTKQGVTSDKITRQAIGSKGNPLAVIGGGLPGNTNFTQSTGFAAGAGATGGATAGAEALIVDLPAKAVGASALSFAVGKVGSYLLQLQLSALIAEGRGEEIASPRVITANKNEAMIESGLEIPFQQATSSGATSVEFKEAVLSLKVTPQITPDDRIIMDLEVSQDSINPLRILGVPAINTRSVTTQVLVDNGETVVLGGVYNARDTKSVDKTPFFGDLPYLGFLFKRTDVDSSKSELLIFITPKIIKEELSL